MDFRVPGITAATLEEAVRQLHEEQTALAVFVLDRLRHLYALGLHASGAPTRGAIEESARELRDDLMRFVADNRSTILGSYAAQMPVDFARIEPHLRLVREESSDDE